MKPRLAPLALAVLCMGTPAAAQEIITLSTQGTGSLVSDELGLFGAPSAAWVDDIPFSMSLSLDTSNMFRDTRPGFAWFQYQDGGSNSLSGELTVNGRVFQWTVLDPRASVYYSAYNNTLDLSLSGSRRETEPEIIAYQTLMPDQDGPGSIMSSDYRDGFELADANNRPNDNGTVFPVAYFYTSSRIACQDCPGGSRLAETWFVSSQSYSARWTVSAVPEPSGWILLFGGLGLLALSGRRTLLASAR